MASGTLERMLDMEGERSPLHWSASFSLECTAASLRRKTGYGPEVISSLSERSVDSMRVEKLTLGRTHLSSSAGFGESESNTCKLQTR